MQKQELLEFLKMVSIFLCMRAYSRTKTLLKFLASSFYHTCKCSLHTPSLYAKKKIDFTSVLIPHGTRLCSLGKALISMIESFTEFNIQSICKGGEMWDI